MEIMFTAYREELSIATRFVQLYWALLIKPSSKMMCILMIKNRYNKNVYPLLVGYGQLEGTRSIDIRYTVTALWLIVYKSNLLSHPWSANCATGTLDLNWSFRSTVFPRLSVIQFYAAVGHWYERGREEMEQRREGGGGGCAPALLLSWAAGETRDISWATLWCLGPTVL